jgi:pimeloyl-ACP methyl ester carboxylesterase
MSRVFQELERAVLASSGLPVTVRSLDIAGGSARALAHGEGPDVVLLPGGNMPAAGWAPLMAELDGFRLHALELPGFCGPSDPCHLQADTIRDQAVRYVEAALDALRVRTATFIASSMGALWTFWLALDRPERVDSIVTMGCPALLPGTSAPLAMRLMSVGPVGRMMMRLMPPSAKQVDTALAGAGVDMSAHPEIRDLVVELERLPHFPTAWLNLMHTVLRPTGPRRDVALTDEQLAAVTQPVQLLWGKDDPFGSVTAGEHAARTILDAEFHVLPGGHAPWLHSRREAARLATDFLRRMAITPDRPSPSD